MISLELARELRDAGLRWDPAPGDRFTILQPELAGEVFTVSEMTIQVHDYPSGTVLGFNGTTEWALDSVTKDDALWLPAEHQLRGMLGAAFLAMRADAEGFTVSTRVGGHEERSFAASTAEDAYGRALLELVARANRGAVPDLFDL